MNHLQAVKTSAPERYLLEEMSELERHAFEEHYFSCADCAEDVRLGALMREGGKAGFLDAEKPVSLAGAKAASTRTRGRPRPCWRWSRATSPSGSRPGSRIGSSRRPWLRSRCARRAAAPSRSCR